MQANSKQAVSLEPKLLRDIRLFILGAQWISKLFLNTNIRRSVQLMLNTFVKIMFMFLFLITVVFPDLMSSMSHF